MLTVGSLFAGIGGLELGLERAGMKVVWQVENDEYARRVLEKHWPGIRRWDDVRTFPPAGDWACDLICGGDPCQAHSAAAGPAQSKQPSLGGEFIRVIDELRPRLVLRENPAHIRRDAPWPWWRFRAALESLGYIVLPFRLRACCVGADHQRERLFLLAEHANTNSNRLEGWNSQSSPEIKPEVISTPLEEGMWNDVCTHNGHRSRAGIPDYVDRLRCLGNAVVPQVAELIGKRIMETEEE